MEMHDRKHTTPHTDTLWASGAEWSRGELIRMGICMDLEGTVWDQALGRHTEDPKAARMLTQLDAAGDAEWQHWT